MARSSVSGRPPKVALVCASSAPLHCGVEDYTERLAKALARAKVPVLRLGGKDWSFGAVRQLLHAARANGCDLIHLQYPAIGFGATLTPHLIGFLSAIPVLVTLHEFSLVHPLRKWSSGLFSLGVDHLIFTTAEERRAFTRAFPWRRNNTAVIPIGSNIPFRGHVPDPDPIVVFFGHIKPNRNVEDVIAVAALARSAGRPYRFWIVGSAGRGCATYLENLQRQAKGLAVEWLLNLGPEEVAAYICRSGVAYFPYPDGVSQRRGSLLAALGNGVPVVTTQGPLCPLHLKEAVRFAAGPVEALQQIDAILRDPAIAEELSRRGCAAITNLAWPTIAATHQELYSSLLSSRTGGGRAVTLDS